MADPQGHSSLGKKRFSSLPVFIQRVKHQKRASLHTLERAVQGPSKQRQRPGHHTSDPIQSIIKLVQEIINPTSNF